MSASMLGASGGGVHNDEERCAEIGRQCGGQQAQRLDAAGRSAHNNNILRHENRLRSVRKVRFTGSNEGGVKYNTLIACPALESVNQNNCSLRTRWAGNYIGTLVIYS